MTRRRLLLLAPLGATVLAGGAFFAMLVRMTQGKFDPRGVPSMIIDKPVPPFDLPDESGAKLTNADLATGRPVLVNFFASWCEPCVEEAPVLMQMKQRGVPIYGIAYKDKPNATLGFLRGHGNPYARIAMDEPGRVAIDWGLYGVPESYLIDGQGIVRWRYVGPLTADVATTQVAGLMRKFA
ncbi:MAG TPA: DsbE family thiol:disulfide interchange protein [Acetobacteraceae bacterium]|jgi:cytochrome c biogenesis protein CcmG/thiol:disulfide interchange protein DsbE|nr:DsbE family thiol:disulfide interchange protein [Acetobacteraceae bacterium]